MKTNDTPSRGNGEAAPTRRQFLAGAAPAVAAAAAALSPRDLLAQAAASVPSLKGPQEIASSLGETPVAGSFEGNGMMGADIFAQLCKKEGLAAKICFAGNYPVCHGISGATGPMRRGPTRRE